MLTAAHVRTVEAFEALHGQPEKRLQLFKKIKTAFERAREAHRVAEARVAAQAPPPEDATAEIEQLEGRETLALEDLDAEEQAALGSPVRMSPIDMPS